jgi:hypothetical protein
MGRDPSSRRHRRWWIALLAYLLAMWAFPALGFAWWVPALVALSILALGATATLVAYLVGGRLADWLTGFRLPVPIPPVAPPDETLSVWPAALAAPATSGIPAGIDPETLPPQAVDWPGLVESMAIRIDAMLGPGFVAHGSGCVLTLASQGSIQRVDLTSLLQAHRYDPTKAAVLACLRLLDAAQMFKMRELAAPWPQRQPETGAAQPVTLARPHVLLRDLEIRLRFEDELGTVLELPSLPWVEGHPEMDGPLRLA